MKFMRSLSLILLGLSTFALAQNPAETENALTRDLTEMVARIFDHKDFSLVANVKSHLESKKTLVEDESQTEQTETPQGEAAAPMPGFENPHAAVPKGEPQKKRSVQRYRMDEVLTYDGVNIHLVLSPKIDENAAKMVAVMLSDKVEARFGLKPEIKIDRLEGLNPELQKKMMEPRDFLQSYLKDYAGSTLSKVLYLIGGLLLLSVVFRSLRELLKQHQAKKADAGQGEKAADKDDKDSTSASAADESLQKAMTHLLNFLHDEPKLSAQFFKNLSRQQAIHLYQSIATQSNRSLLARNLSFTESELQEGSLNEDSKVALRTLQELAREVDYFKQIHAAQSKARFGFLALLSGRDILELIPAEKTGIYLRIIFSHLSATQIQDVLQGLTPDQKFKLFSEKDSRRISDAEASACDKDLRERLEGSHGRSSSEAGYGVEQLLISMLDQDPKAADTLRDLEQNGLHVPQHLEKFRIQVVDIFQMDAKVVAALLAGMDNQDVVSLLAQYPDASDQIMQSLTDLRRKIINGMLESGEAGTAARDQAEVRLLRSYRKMAER